MCWKMPCQRAVGDGGVRAAGTQLGLWSAGCALQQATGSTQLNVDGRVITSLPAPRLSRPRLTGPTGVEAGPRISKAKPASHLCAVHL